ncbi:hypothetical protein NIES2135_03430 [Leptolyngbya boryana NIES-2135]|jgi:hypothetical protein|uniref:Uncharacterized protein n=1 Tax=Leptolyngbya boryana NIES-2135 TaxID=1973484 RepID=A0A1Z4JAS8_LEPBY|nr:MULTISPECIES: hypothetical protein [Leptolyngbya]BAY53537.1 hypothetical protein NIES2135_03430 [Leptolyngbya boryana NIES-2135]MBD2366603.1 hypothetical protein [Leptolyngbya sp. FACHB-161]MBD2373384.1 hypothetical protein [Leptolyngbya sp. FACHB-238]MBD2397783.1 hypothetical protein [Leptolyngbya sp. FACHB-239]MBD2407443.1 hypothetical protein [Leptolyngbya sp. FACHB-402]
MAIIALKAWYLEQYEPIRELEKRPHDLRLSKNSLLKSGLRADFLEDSDEVKKSSWFQRYLLGEIVEFYIEGSGGYAISNIDLSSHEIYFSKQEVMANLEPEIFFSYQNEFDESSDLIREELISVVESLNRRSRLPLTLRESHRLSEGAIRLNSSLMRSIRQSLLFIGDATSIAEISDTPPLLIPSPKVCIETGYALSSKRTEQVLMVQMERSDMPGYFPFDLPSQNRLTFKDKTQLRKLLPKAIESQLHRFNLL